MLENATRLCQAEYGNLFLRTDNEDEFRYAAMHGLPSSYTDWGEREPLVRMRDLPHAPLTRMAQTRKVLHIADLTKDRSYVEREARIVALVEAAGARTIVAVPMLKEDELVGGLALYRREVRPFTNKQIELVKNFASQAVIAIENARLLNELRQSLEQQTATADVLKVISRSTFDLQTVLQTLVQSAAHLCQADKATITRQRGELFYRAEAYGFSVEFLDYVRSIPVMPERGSALGRALLEGKVVHIADVQADPEYTFVEAQRLGDFRTVLGVPILREGVSIGVLALTRSEVSAFTDRQIELVSIFADQAAIAIENARLLNELRQRTADLTEALDQQTATSEVLKIISSSPGELQPVFDALLANATRICEAKFGMLLHFDGEAFRFAAEVGTPPEFAKFLRRGIPITPQPGSHLDRVMRTKQVSHTADYAAEGVPSPPVTLGGARSTVDVPMVKDDNQLIGAFSIYRQEVRPFTDKQIELLQNFAAQAVIAIENARLLNELRESLEQQTATADVLKVVSASPGELEPVFSAMLESATRICGAEFGILFKHENGAIRPIALRGVPDALARHLAERGAMEPTPGSSAHFCLLSGGSQVGRR